jgi:hypothetical protein
MADKLPQVALFCDEAGKETDRFLAVGGLVITAEATDHVRNEMGRHFRRLGINSEMKWSKTRSGTKDKYQELVHFFFQLLDDNLISFHCLLVDFQRFDHGVRPDGSPQESLKRMYYQLILHRLCKKHPNCDLYAFPDKANELQGLDRMKAGLNGDSRRRFNLQRDCLRAIEFRNSESEPLLQLNDHSWRGLLPKKQAVRRAGGGTPKGQSGWLHYGHGRFIELRLRHPARTGEVLYLESQVATAERGRVSGLPV